MMNLNPGMIWLVVCGVAVAVLFFFMTGLMLDLVPPAKEKSAKPSKPKIRFLSRPRLISTRQWLASFGAYTTSHLRHHH